MWILALVSGLSFLSQTVRCGNPIEGPLWILHCWDNAPNHIMDPFCQQYIACSSPPSIDNGLYRIPYTQLVNSTVVYTCNPGYQIVGTNTITCIENDDYTATWTQKPKCERVCPEPPSVPLATFEPPPSLFVGTVVNYTCDDYYELMSASNSFVCGPDGQWAGRVVCKIVPCNEAPSVDHSTNTAGNRSVVGEVVTYTCDAGYKFAGNETKLTCMGNDTWIYSLPKCEPIVCPDPPSVLLATFEPPTSLFVGTVVNYTCDKFYELKSNESSYVCGPDGQWTGGIVCQIVPCYDPPFVEFATNNAGRRTEVGETINYTCNTGYHFAGNGNSLMCIGNDTWVYSLPKCELTGCAAPPSIDNGCVLGLAQQTTPPVPYTTPFYPFSTPSVFISSPAVTNVTDSPVNCTEDADGCVDLNGNNTTSGNTIITPSVNDEDYTCEDLAMMNRTIIDGLGPWPPGTEMVYVCDAGFRRTSLTAECVKDGVTPYWSHVPSCIPVCGSPPDINHGTVTFNDTDAGAKALYVCDDHYIPEDGKEYIEATCLSNHTWSPIPTCIPYCGIVPRIDNSNLTKVINESFTSLYKVTCYEKYRLIGEQYIWCDDVTYSVPKWTTLPYCQCRRSPVDIVFIVDGSGSVTELGFNQTLAFINDIVSRFPPEITRFGLEIFSTFVSLEFNLGDFVNDTAGMIGAINNATYPGGSTATYDALEFARVSMFDVANGMRPGVGKAAIVLTDGQSGNLTETTEQAELLRNMSVSVYAVGVGQYADMVELLAIASHPEYVFTVQDYNSIMQVSGPLSSTACEAHHVSSRSVDEDENEDDVAEYGDEDIEYEFL